VHLAVDASSEVTRWKPLVQWLLAIPHLVILYALRTAAQAIGIVSWFWILATGTLPAGLASFQAMYLRYGARTYAYVGFLHEDYPPFAFVATPEDPGDEGHVRFDVEPRLEGRNRLTVFFRVVLVIPHALVLALLGLALAVVMLVAAVAVLVTGRWPGGLQPFVVAVARWSLRVDAYLLLLVDDYPPFAFDDLGARTTDADPVGPPPAPA
jgi:hypothetical protein